ncbi:MAG: hypothetical protein AVDCRST_MAG50-2302 [uncultured Acidimicrobiales bacterium]|uniref:Uncharacterized protein n=1 Tax=uncultured Acidimicrobiales bacterium TaxID=310071 RepID=A0A6J4IGM7_9ACTN|nr:MAG: hypothetical protein AVDCRST_MAG50-2302 [uncultured Acidimicrobiales bacterium]
MEDEPPNDVPAPVIAKVQGWRKRSVTGALLAGAMLGLEEALTDRKKPEIVREMDDSGDPTPDGVALDLHPTDPAQSTARVRRPL